MGPPYRFTWIDQPFVCAMAFPESVEDLRWLRGKGVQVLLSLTEEPVRRDWANEAGMLVVHVPVEDYEAPSQEQLDLCVASIERAKASNMGVAVHCQAGLGRTGTVLAAYLVASGKKPQDAIRHIRELRPGSIETAEQAQAIGQYAKRREADSGSRS